MRGAVEEILLSSTIRQQFVVRLGGYFLNPTWHRRKIFKVPHHKLTEHTGALLCKLRRE